MADNQPTTRFDARFSDQGTSATPWSDAAALLENAEVFWLSTVRRDGRPHVTPLLAVWVDDALHFCTGPEEQKALNLHTGPHVAVTTGTNTMDKGLDLVVEGDAVRVHDEAQLHRLTKEWVTKYGEDWRFEVRDGDFYSEPPGRVEVYEVKPDKVIDFGKGLFSQTSWRFADHDG